MILCIPTVDNRGMDARLADHFGRAAFFTLVDTSNGNAVTILNRNAEHEHGRCKPTESLESLQLDKFICRGIGRRAVEKLRTLNREVYLVDAETVAEALEAYCVGRLHRITADEMCAGHSSHFDVHGSERTTTHGGSHH